MDILNKNREELQGIDMLASNYAAQLHKSDHGFVLELQMRLGYLPSRQQMVLAEVFIEIEAPDGSLRYVKDLQDDPQNQNPHQSLMLMLPLSTSEFGSKVRIHQRTQSTVQKELLFTVPSEIWTSSSEFIDGIARYFGLLLVQLQSSDESLQ